MQSASLKPDRFSLSNLTVSIGRCDSDQYEPDSALYSVFDVVSLDGRTSLKVIRPGGKT
jgi:hypothetical protein